MTPALNSRFPFPVLVDITPTVKPLENPDLHHARAAQGWLELGNPAEAEAELENISHPQLNHPVVLEIRWETSAKQAKWDLAKDIARTIVAESPDDASGWLHLSYATRRATGGSVQDAWDVLLPVGNRFPKVALVSYNLACYACQLGKPIVAWKWLQKAFESGDRDHFKFMALHDSDLQPLWKKISAI